MGSKTKYIVIYTDDEGPEVQGVYSDEGDEQGKSRSLQRIGELMVSGHDPEGFEVEMWEGSRFKGTFNHEGRLIEKSDGTAVPT